MKFTPDYAVMYKGVRHTAGKRFEIDPKDADEMSKHGTVENHKTPAEHIEDATNEMPLGRRTGRPKKN